MEFLQAKKKKSKTRTAEEIFIERDPDYRTKVYFTKYAMPCAGVRVNMGKLSKERLQELWDNFKKGIAPEREDLEEIFEAAFRRLKKLANEMQKNYWDFEVIQEYWLKNHNEVIDEGEGNYAYAPESFKDFCKVHKAKIVDKKEGFLRVRYGTKERIVRNWFVPEAKVGDTVTIHHSHAIEKLD